MRLEVKQLSALGSSTQQAEVNDVVRQLREKHARDMASWQKVVAELEGQISTYKVCLHRPSNFFINDIKFNVYFFPL